ncbi:MAG: 5'-nucleotidase C-terminal domain-containing protein [Gemmatimonadaceae bacterium]
MAASTISSSATPAASPPAACDDTTRLVVVSTTDVHGRLRGWDYESNRPDSIRGLTRAATVIDSIRAANPGRVILLDAGDLLQGNMLAYVAARVTPDTVVGVVAAMNAMRYDASAIGNHEYNYGVPYLDRAVRQASFPFLSANTYLPDGSHAYRPFAVIERSGIKVGVVGATTPGVMIWDRDNVRGRVSLGDIVPAIRAAADSARLAGADIVIATVHTGLNEPSSYDTASTGLPSENVAARIANEVPGLALVVYGHSHKENAGSTIDSTRMLQPKNWAQSVGWAMIPVTRCGTARGVTTATIASGVIPVAGHAEQQGVVAATEDLHRRTLAYVTAPIGTTPLRWNGDSARVRDVPVTDFVLEVMRRTAHTDLAAGSAFSFSGLDSGTISIADLARIYPYDNTLRAVKISGAQLRAYLEQSARYYGTLGDGAEPVIDPTIPGYNFDIVAGGDYTLDLSRPKGSRVTRLKFRGQDVAPGDSFTMALNNYRQTGGGGYAMLAGAPVVFESDSGIRNLLEREVRTRKTIRPSDYFHRNWEIVPAAAVTRAYAAMHRSAYEGERARKQPSSSEHHVRVISTNDFHGALEPRADGNGVLRGGAAYVATAIARAKAGCVPPRCATLVVDGGDEWQGTPASNLAYGRPGIPIFERWGVAASALGNHEFDWTTDTLRARMRQADYGIFAANVLDSASHDVGWIRNDTIVRRGTLRIGIIGLATTATPTTTKAQNVVGLRFVTQAPIVDSLARRLRVRGAQLVIVIAHAGAFCDATGTDDCKGEIIDLANALREPVDEIVSGHTHTKIDAVVNGIPVVQARSRGEAIAVADIYPSQRGLADSATAHVVEVLTDSLPADPVVAAMVKAAVGAVQKRMSAMAATIASAMNHSGDQYALGNLVADAQRWSAKADVAVMNNGGIRANLRAGTATFGDLYEVQPFGNTLFRFTLPGAVLRSYVEQLVGKRLNVHVSGLTVRYDSSRPAGSRIVSLTLANGDSVTDDGRYTLAMNDFMATGGDGLALGNRSVRVEDLKTVDLDAFVAYLRSRKGPISPPTEPRFIDVAGGAPQ